MRFEVRRGGTPHGELVAAMNTEPFHVTTSRAPPLANQAGLAQGPPAMEPKSMELYRLLVKHGYSLAGIQYMTQQVASYAHFESTLQSISSPSSATHVPPQASSMDGVGNGLVLSSLHARLSRSSTVDESVHPLTNCIDSKHLSRSSTMDGSVDGSVDGSSEDMNEPFETHKVLDMFD